MPNNQGGMSGIEAISGVQAPSSSTKFDSRAFDIAFNDGAGMVGMNPFFRPPETATKIFMA